jgi:ubiquinone/menaquinone biosynthesis C-methylase UbiE
MNTDLTVREGYSRWAQVYDTDPNPVLALEERHLRRLLPDVFGKSILDLACGTGRWIPRLLARGARRVIGIDLSGAMLSIAAGKAGIRDRLVLADCERLPFQAAVFDLVLCSFALNHFRTLDAVIQELARTLKERSSILISEMHPDAYAQGWRPGFRDARSAAQIETVGRSSERVISDFRENGFTCSSNHDLTFGEAELPIFLKAGKAAMFDDACRVPAVKLYEFRNADSAASC